MQYRIQQCYESWALASKRLTWPLEHIEAERESKAILLNDFCAMKSRKPKQLACRASFLGDLREKIFKRA